MKQRYSKHLGNVDVFAAFLIFVICLLLSIVLGQEDIVVNLVSLR
jgi:hypothetical protein